MTALKNLPRWPQHDASPAPSASDDGGVVRPDDLVAGAEHHFNVSGTSVLAAWGLTLVATIIIVTLYSLARRKSLSESKAGKALAMIYLPRKAACENKVKTWTGWGPGFVPPKVPEVGKQDTFFQWCSKQTHIFWKELRQPLQAKPIQSHDEEMLMLIGLDGVTYLQFLRMLRWLFALIAIIVALPLALANYYMNTGGDLSTSNAKDAANSATARIAHQAQQNSSDVLNNLQMFTAAGLEGNAFWVHIGFEWVISSFALAFIVGHSWYHGQLVQFWVDENQCHIAFKTLMVTNFRIERVTPKYKTPVTIAQAKDKVCTMLRVKERAGNEDCAVVLNYRELEDLSKMIADCKENHYPKFEKRVFTFARKYKEPHRHFYGNCFDRFCGQPKTREDLKTAMDTMGEDLEMKRNAIKKEQESANELITAQDDTLLDKTVTSAFITFRTAKRAYQVLYSKHKSGIRVSRAPRQQRIVWKNLHYDHDAQWSHWFSGWLFLAIVLLLNTVPLIGLTVLANADTLADNWQALGNFRDTNDLTKAVFTAGAGVILPLVAALCAYVLPLIVRWLDKWAGALSRGEMDKHVIGRLFGFQLFSSFVVFSLLGVIWDTFLSIKDEFSTSTWSELFNQLGDIPLEMSKIYISESAYWLSWYPIHTAVAAVGLWEAPRVAIKFWQLVRADQRRPTQLKDLVQPRSFELAIEYSHVLFAMGVALIYAPLAPLVVIAALPYFWLISIVHYNQLLYVEDCKETDGMCWQVVKNRLLAATVLMQLLMTLTVALKTKSPAMTTCAFVPVGFCIAFQQLDSRTNYFCRRVDPAQLHVRGEKDDVVPHFKHELLDDSWRPNLHWPPTDQEVIQHIIKNYWWGRRIFRNHGSNENGDAEKGVVMEHRGRRNKHRGRRKY